jgi:uncharacterized protein
MTKHVFRIGETEQGAPVRIDLETFISTRGVFIANSGGGKSYALRTIVEQSAQHVQWIIIDPEGEYSSLRQMFPEMLLVGKEGELPVDVRSAKLLARKVMENRLSTIVDLYGLLDVRAQWAAEFISALINLPRDLWSPVVVAIDEAHRLAPETPTGNREEREALNRSRRATIMLADSGRKQARGAVIASQRVSKLAADARAELRNRFIGLTVQDLDRDRAADDLGFTKAQARGLRDLNAGEFYVYGPAFVGLKGIIKIKFDLPQTKHPKTGSQRLVDVPPASEALKTIVTQIGDLPKQADEEAHDLAAAQRRIAQLEREAKARPVQVQPAAPQIKIERVEIPIFKDGEVGRLQGVADQLVTVGNQLVVASREITGAIQAATRMKPLPAPVITKVHHSAPRPAAIPIESDVKLPKAERSILTVLAQYPDGRTVNQVALLAGYAVGTGGFNNAIGALRSKGYIHGGKDRLQITEQGYVALGPVEELPTGRALIDYWMRKLGKAERCAFEVLVRIYPDEMDRETLASEAGYTPGTGGINNAMSRLRTLELAVGRVRLRANDTLFE